jgi:hypothetical protein
MATKAQRKATRTHRHRVATRGLVRVEVQAPKWDVGLIRTVAQTLRGDPAKADSLRSVLAGALSQDGAVNAFDIFGSDLPDEVFADVFGQSRQKEWRKLEL